MANLLAFTHRKVHGKYGIGPVDSTNFLRLAATVGRWKSSQKISISRRNSS